MAVIPTFGRWRQKEQGFKFIPSHIAVLKTTWDTCDTVLKQNKTDNHIMPKLKTCC